MARADRGLCTLAKWAAPVNHEAASTHIPTSPAHRAPFEWLETVGTICRVEQVRRAPVDHSGANSDAAQRPALTDRTAALAAAYHQRLAWGGRPLLVGWCRPSAGRPVTVLSATDPASSALPSALSFPPGTAGRPVDPVAVMGLLSPIRWWVPLAGAIDAVLPTSALGSVPPAGSVLEEGLLGAWHGPFAWLLYADPVPPDMLERVASETAQAERDARTRGSSPQYVLRAERAALRHRDLSTGASTGLWRIRLVAGGTDAASALAVAGLVMAGSDLGGTPYSLAPLALTDDLSTALSTEAEGVGEHRYPFFGPSALVARLAHVPSTEIPGVRLVERSTFDVTPEIPETAQGITLGTVLDHDELPAGRLRISNAALNRHTFVCGATGAGKSQTVRALLEELSRAPEPVPWLVIEPAKAEYGRMAGRLRDHTAVLVIRPGDPDTIPGCLNPLEPEPGFPLQTHIDLVRALFQAAFEAHEPFPQVLARALTQCYEDLGWQVALGEPANPNTRRYPTLSDLRRVALRVVDQIGYGREVTNNIRGFIDVRLGSLSLGTPGLFFEGGHPLDLTDLLARNTVLELEDIGNDQDKAFFIGAMLIRITEHLRRRHSTDATPALRHVTVIEEAHRLLKRVEPGSPAAHSVELFASLLAEVRAYGEGIVVAEQIPAKIITDVVKNSAVKIVHRLPAQDDRHAVGTTMNLSDHQSRQVVTLPAGRAAVFVDGMDHPVLVAMPLGEQRENAAPADRTPKITRSRSSACGTECHRTACTLRQMSAGTRLAIDPKLTLWIELLVIAHLVGQPAPVPSKTWLADLHGQGDLRTLQCAVAQRIQTAIDERYAALTSYYPPEDFAEHLSQHTAEILAGREGTCLGGETQWQAGRYRWIDVELSLRKQATSAHTNQPHPDTAAWSQRGLALPTSPIANQIEALHRHQDLWKPPQQLVTGWNTPTTVEASVHALSPASDAAKFREATEHLTLPWTWPLDIPGLVNNNSGHDT